MSSRELLGFEAYYRPLHNGFEPAKQSLSDPQRSSVVSFADSISQSSFLIGDVREISNNVIQLPAKRASRQNGKEYVHSSEAAKEIISGSTPDKLISSSGTEKKPGSGKNFLSRMLKSITSLLPKNSASGDRGKCAVSQEKWSLNGRMVARKTVTAPDISLRNLSGRSALSVRRAKSETALLTPNPATKNSAQDQVESKLTGEFKHNITMIFPDEEQRRIFTVKVETVVEFFMLELQSKLGEKKSKNLFYKEVMTDIHNSAVDSIFEIGSVPEIISFDCKSALGRAVFFAKNHNLSLDSSHRAKPEKNTVQSNLARKIQGIAAFKQLSNLQKVAIENMVRECFKKKVVASMREDNLREDNHPRGFYNESFYLMIDSVKGYVDMKMSSSSQPRYIAADIPRKKLLA